ncbi:MAG: hypothetical protein IJL22_01625 [Bacteroidales bacterium]|nr:hypothetical protein [Bacteroidales bacterium]
MKRLFTNLSLCIIILCGCDQIPIGENLVATIDSSHVTCISAVITGVIDGLDDPTNNEAGIILSTEKDVPVVSSKFIKAETIKQTGSFEIQLSNLEPSTSYYCRLYTNIDNKVWTSEVYTFETRSLDTMLKTMPADSVHFFDARLNGYINMQDIPYSGIVTGFLMGVVRNNLETKINCSNSEKLTVKLNNLQASTQYYYCAFLNIDGDMYLGDTLSFSTSVAQDFIQTLEATHITCLSAALDAELNVEGVEYDSIEYGIMFGETATPESKYSTPFKATGLKPNTDYYYQAYVIFNNSQEYLGGLKSFKTRQPWINDVNISVEPTKTGISINREKIEEINYTINAIILRAESANVLDLPAKDIVWDQYEKKQFYLKQIYVDLPIGETVYGICLEDNYGNRTDTLKYKIRTDYMCCKLDPTLFKNAALADDTMTSNSKNYPIEALWDGSGLSSVPHFFASKQGQVPGWLTIDLGQVVALSSIHTLPRIGYMAYGGGNPRLFEFWGSMNPSGLQNADNEHQFDDSWFCLGKFEQQKPSGYAPDGSVGVITAEDIQVYNSGNDFRFDPKSYPRCYDELRYLRVVITDTFASYGTNNYSGVVYFGEITPYIAIDHN